MARVQARPLPPDLYGDDDGDVAYYPGGTRNQARAVAASWWGEDYTRVHAYRIHLRAMTDQEKQDHGFGGPDYGICAIACPADHPEATPGWRVELW